MSLWMRKESQEVIRLAYAAWVKANVKGKATKASHA